MGDTGLEPVTSALSRRSRAGTDGLRTARKGRKHLQNRPFWFPATTPPFPPFPVEMCARCAPRSRRETRWLVADGLQDLSWRDPPRRIRARLRAVERLALSASARSSPRSRRRQREACGAMDSDHGRVRWRGGHA